ncbi:MAG: hypothetical protein JNM89_05775 [Hyphomicrobiaceae bacterium]|nr:hypothetical protein [Hyphomicrobiaceae bacterium]
MTVAAGGSVVDAVTSAAMAFAQIPVWNEVGDFLVQAGLAASTAATALVHGVVGGAMSMVQGGSFLQGFAANAIGAFGADIAGGVTSDIAPHTAIVAAAGCAAAAATGGKCAEGATTAAFANLFNHFAHKWAGQGAVIGSTAVAGASIAVTAGTGGLNILATPVEIFLGGLIGGGIGYVAGSVYDLLDSGIFNNSTLEPGPNAGESIPARGPDRDFTPEERDRINEIGKTTGCHTCGTTDPGTKSGNFIPDHQPPSALNPDGLPQRLYPHCLHCSGTQGDQVRGSQ